MALPLILTSSRIISSQISSNFLKYQVWLFRSSRNDLFARQYVDLISWGRSGVATVEKNPLLCPCCGGNLVTTYVHVVVGASCGCGSISQCHHFFFIVVAVIIVHHQARVVAQEVCICCFFNAGAFRFFLVLHANGLIRWDLSKQYLKHIKMFKSMFPQGWAVQPSTFQVFTVNFSDRSLILLTGSSIGLALPLVLLGFSSLSPLLWS